MKISDISRKQAFLSHLMLSSGIFVILSYLIVFEWYPSFYFEMDGGVLGISTIFFVDVVLGPGLTLLVFKPKKKSLKFDMSVIILCQIAALAWGIKSVYEDRPALTVFYLGKFTCMTQSYVKDVNMEDISKSVSGKQKLAYLKSPESPKEKFRFQFEAIANSSSEIYYYTSRFEPLNNSNVDDVLRYEMDWDALKRENEELYNSVFIYKDKHKMISEYYHYYPISSRFKNGIAVYDSREMKIVDIIKGGTRIRATIKEKG